MECKYSIDCHVAIENGGGNVVYANGNHQVALTVWFKLQAVDESTCLESSEDFIERIAHISLVDLEKDVPFESEQGWAQSPVAKQWSTYVERRQGEYGSKPEDESGYIKKTIYLSHALNYEGGSKDLVGVQVFIPASHLGEDVLATSNEGIRIYREPVRKYLWMDFVVEPQTVSIDDSSYYWGNGDNYRNLWRSRNYTVKFNPNTYPNKKVSRVDYSSGYPVGSGRIYSTRMNEFYEIDGYIWPFNGAQNQREATILLSFPGNTVYQQFTFSDGGGFTITLASFVKTSTWPVDDSVNEAMNTSTEVTVYDEKGTQIYLYLNQVIPTSWKAIRNDQDSFSTKLLGNDNSNTVVSKVVKTFSWRNGSGGYMFPTYGDENDENSSYLANCGNGAASYYRQAAFGTNQAQVQIQDTLGRWHYISMWTHDGKVFAVNDASNWTFYPKWDVNGFCISFYNGKIARFIHSRDSTVAYGEGQSNDSHYVWYIDTGATGYIGNLPPSA